MKMGDIPKLYSIFQGEVCSLQPYGIFVKIPGNKKNGLVHKSQMSKTRIENPEEMVAVGERVYCKVISTDAAGNKIALSMKVVNQTTGRDEDPGHVQTALDEQRRKTGHIKDTPRIQLGAVLDTTCSKCGGKGHFVKDCFYQPGSKKYDLLPDLAFMAEQQAKEEQETVKLQKVKKHKKKDKSKKKEKKRGRQHSSSDSSSEHQRKKSKKKRKKLRKLKKRVESSSESDTSSSSESEDERKTKNKHSSVHARKHSLEETQTKYSRQKASGRERSRSYSPRTKSLSKRHRSLSPTVRKPCRDTRSPERSFHLDRNKDYRRTDERVSRSPIERQSKSSYQGSRAERERSRSPRRSSLGHGSSKQDSSCRRSSDPRNHNKSKR